MSSLSLAFFKLLVLTRPRDWMDFKVAACIIYCAILDAEVLCYATLAAKPFWVALLVFFTSSPHTKPPNASTAPYFLWALVRAHIILHLLLSKCDFRADYISLLPTEVLNQIFLDASADLPALSRVSKRFHEIAQPELYAAVSFIKEARPSRPHVLLLFMRTIGKSPELAKNVRSFEFNCTKNFLKTSADESFSMKQREVEVAVARTCTDYVTNSRYLSRVTRNQDLKIGQLQVHGNLHFRANFSKHVLTTNRGAHTNLLLLWLPHLKSLSLQGYTWHRVGFFALVEWTIEEKTIFTQLKHLDLSCKPDFYQTTSTKLLLGDFKLVSQLPSLRSLAVVLFEFEEAPLPCVADNPPNQSAVTSLVSNSLVKIL